MPVPCSAHWAREEGAGGGAQEAHGADREPAGVAALPLHGEGAERRGLGAPERSHHQPRHAAQAPHVQ